MSLNVELLQRVKAHILEEPRRLEMYTWIDAAPEHPDAPPCGAVACIAGWTCILAGDPEPISTRRRAMDLLGLDFLHSEVLFFVDHWPADLARKHKAAWTNEARAAAAAERIDRFIAEHGEQGS